MPVGAGSINRAARTGKKAAETAKTTKVIDTAEAVQAPVPKKKTASTKAAAPKKSTDVKKAAVFVVGNEVCHLTEELPVHLL